jgi:hypothetical protein
VVDVASAASVVEGAGVTDVAVDPDDGVVGELTAASEEHAAISNPQVSTPMGTQRVGADREDRDREDRDRENREVANCGGMEDTMHDGAASGLPPSGVSHSSIGMRCGARR